MGNVIVYTGQAGTGKTTSLINYLKAIIPKKEWKNHETILALTFMHGSRKRLESKLNFIKKEFKIKVHCSTIDSFALDLVNRFRCYFDLNKQIKVNLENDSKEETQFEFSFPLVIIQEYAISLLKIGTIQKYLFNSFPYIILDEFQDCHGNLLQIVTGLSIATNLIIATDPFQQLIDTEHDEGNRWIKENRFLIYDLDIEGNKRTNKKKLLNTATCLRKGEKQQGEKVQVFTTTLSKGVTSSFIKKNIFFNLIDGNMAIITPSSKNRFVTTAISELSTTYTFSKGQHIGKKIGPYNHLIKANDASNIENILSEFSQSTLTKEKLKELKCHAKYIIRRSAEILLKKLSLRGGETISFDHFKRTIRETAHTYDNFFRKDDLAKILFTTVHGAKNKEFDSVIILWPYQVSGNLLYKRKLLYNAVTRAKKNAIILVQHKNMNKEELLEDELFKLILDKEIKT